MMRKKKMTCSEEMVPRHHSDPNFAVKMFTMDEIQTSLFNTDTKDSQASEKMLTSGKKIQIGARAEKTPCSIFLGPKNLSSPILP